MNSHSFSLFMWSIFFHTLLFLWLSEHFTWVVNIVCWTSGHFLSYLSLGDMVCNIDCLLNKLSSKETLSALLDLCAGNSPVFGEFPSQRPVTRSLDVFFDLLLNKRLSKESRRWWFETPSSSLWRHYDIYLFNASATWLVSHKFPRDSWKHFRDDWPSESVKACLIRVRSDSP